MGGGRRREEIGGREKEEVGGGRREDSERDSRAHEDVRDRVGGRVVEERRRWMHEKKK